MKATRVGGRFQRLVDKIKATARWLSSKELSRDPSATTRKAQIKQEPKAKPKAKSQKPRAKSQEPKAGSQKPGAFG